MSVSDSAIAETYWEKRDRLDANTALEIHLSECASCPDGYYDAETESVCAECYRDPDGDRFRKSSLRACLTGWR